MKYERPEAEVVEFKTLEANAAQGWTKSDGVKYVETTSLFQFESGVMERENFN